MNISNRNETKRIIPFISHLEKISSSNGDHRARKNMANNKQKQFARDVVKRITAKVKRI